jgi:hypothetical protein
MLKSINHPDDEKTTTFFDGCIHGGGTFPFLCHKKSSA